MLLVSVGFAEELGTALDEGVSDDELTELCAACAPIKRPERKSAGHHSATN